MYTNSDRQNHTNSLPEETIDQVRDALEEIEERYLGKRGDIFPTADEWMNAPLWGDVLAAIAPVLPEGFDQSGRAYDAVQTATGIIPSSLEAIVESIDVHTMPTGNKPYPGK